MENQDILVLHPFCLGSYPEGFFFADRDIIWDCHTGSNSFVQTVLRHFPKSEVMMLYFHSAVNAYAYSVYRNGRLLREIAGIPPEYAHPFAVEKGDLLPEEIEPYSRSFVRDGARIFIHDFRGKPEESPIYSCVEDLIFLVAARALGSPLDKIDLDLQTELFHRSVWKKPLELKLLQE